MQSAEEETRASGALLEAEREASLALRASIGHLKKKGADWKAKIEAEEGGLEELEGALFQLEEAKVALDKQIEAKREKNARLLQSIEEGGRELTQAEAAAQVETRVAEVERETGALQSELAGREARVAEREAEKAAVEGEAQDTVGETRKIREKTAEVESEAQLKRKQIRAEKCGTGGGD